MACQTTNRLLLPLCAAVGGAAAVSTPFAAFWAIRKTNEIFPKDFWDGLFVGVATKTVRLLETPVSRRDVGQHAAVAISLAGFSFATLLCAGSARMFLRDALLLVRSGGIALYGPSYSTSCCFRARYSFRTMGHFLAGGGYVASTALFGGLSSASALVLFGALKVSE